MQIGLHKSISFNTIIDIGLIKKKKEKKALEIMSTFSIITRTKKFRFFFIVISELFFSVLKPFFIWGPHTPLALSQYGGESVPSTNI